MCVSESQPSLSILLPTYMYMYILANQSTLTSADELFNLPIKFVEKCISIFLHIFSGTKHESLYATEGQVRFDKWDTK